MQHSAGRKPTKEAVLCGQQTDAVEFLSHITAALVVFLVALLLLLDLFHFHMYKCFACVFACAPWLEPVEVNRGHWIRCS